ncbi:MAG: uracil-DNA glycosylase [Bdellovibrionota bacterium]|nr:MAG: uracil-DNA glycosylase [Bdellovibrionota bacterium]
MEGQLDLLDPRSIPVAPVPSWKDVLQGERHAQYFKSIMDFIEKERAAGKVIYPKNSEIFNALQLTPFDAVKVVIIGQDPYHGPNQAHGLCFSVKAGVAPPPSLQNIFKELQSDLGVQPPPHGCLEHWARQGVLLLNTSLSVEAGKPQSHAGIGWEHFTDKVIRELNQHRKGVVFLLWGSHAQKKGQLIDRSKHHVLEAPHPSPLSANRGFFGCKHFSKTNQLLTQQGLTPINWCVL